MIGLVDVEQERLKIENAINDSIRPTPYTYNKKAYERNDTATLEIDKERYDKLSEALDIPTTDINVLKSLGLVKNGQYNNAAALIADQNDYKGKGMHLICYQDESMTKIIDRVSLENVSILKHFDACMNFFLIG